MTDIRLDYVGTLDPHLRADAAVWATMPREEFQVRLGMGFEEIKATLAEMRTPFWKQAARGTGLVTVAGVVVEAVRLALHDPSMWRR